MAEVDSYIFYPSGGQVCISSGLSVVLYTAVTFLTVMFTVIANQIIISKDRETRRVEEEFKRLKSVEEAQTEENEEILH